MAADCTDGDYLGAYSRFFAEFIERVNPNDQLPVNVRADEMTEGEIVGEIISVSLQYLNQSHCPPSLQGHVVRQVLQEIKTMCKKQPEECGLRLQEKTFDPLKLMKAITNKVNEICTRYLDNSRLALLPPPPSNPLPAVLVGSTKNLRRKMEDRHVILHDLHSIFSIQDDSTANYYAVFDGHGGRGAAVYCATHLHQYLVESIYYPTDPERALRDAFLTTDAQFIEKSKRHKVSGGSTAICSLIVNKKLYIAWVGDSEGILVRRGEITSLTNPHRLFRFDEVQRVQEMGGFVMTNFGVMRVNGILEITRAIGDVQFKPFVTGEPEIKTVTLDGTEDFLVIATDGLWDFVPRSEVVSIVYQEILRRPNVLKGVEEVLLDRAKQKGSADNITVIVVFLTPACEIAERPQNAHPFLNSKLKPNDPLNNMDSNNPFLSNANGLHETANGGFIKQVPQLLRHQQDQNGEEEQMDDNHIIYDTSSNGKHENGDTDYDYTDLGPETNVDTIDDMPSVPPVKNLASAFYAADADDDDDDDDDDDSSRDEDHKDIDDNRMEIDHDVPMEHESNADSDQEIPDNQFLENRESVINANFDLTGEFKHPMDDTHVDGVEVDGKGDVVDEAGHVDYDDTPPSPQTTKPLQHALIPEADNVADTEDSEDEWNYYRVDPNKQKDSVDLDDEQQDHRAQQQDYRDEQQGFRDDVQDCREKQQDCRETEQNYKDRKQEKRDKAQDDREHQQDYRQEQQDYRDKQQNYRDEQQNYRDEQQDYRDEQQDFREQQDYRDDQQDYRGEEQDYTGGEQAYRDEEREYRHEKQDYRYEQSNYRDKEKDDREKQEPESTESVVKDHTLEEQEIECESPTDEEPLEHIDTKSNAKEAAELEEGKTFVEEKQTSEDMEFQLNPDAAEFIPVSPQIITNRLNLTEDFPISGSPLKQVPPMDDIQLPSQSEFEEEVCQRPREIEGEEKECTNGDHTQRTDYPDFMMERQKMIGLPGNLDDSEISSTKAEFGDESTASFLTASEFHRTGISTMDGSFACSEREYDIAKDPMAMSFTPKEFEAVFDKGVDLNAVHDLTDADLDVTNGTIEDDVINTAGKQSEVNDLMSCETEQEVDVSAFNGEKSEIAYTSAVQLDAEGETTFIEHSNIEEPKIAERVDLQEENQSFEAGHFEAQDIAKSEHSPLVDNYSADFESEKEPVSADNEQLLSPSSVDIDETKPIDEPSEDAAFPATDSQKEDYQKDGDTPSSLSPVPDAMECTTPQKDYDLLSSMQNVQISSTPIGSSLHYDAPEFKPHQYNLDAYTAECTVSSTTTQEKLQEDVEPQQMEVEELKEPIVPEETVPMPVVEDQPKGNLLDFDDEPEVCMKSEVKLVDTELTPPHTPQEADNKVPEDADELCPITSNIVEEHEVDPKPEETLIQPEACDLQTPQDAAYPGEFESEIRQEMQGMNLSESMQEFTGLEKQLLPEDFTPVESKPIELVESQLLKEEEVKVVEDEEKPVEEEVKPVEEVKPMEEEVKPVEEEVKPVEDEVKPVEEEVKPMEEEVKPVEEEIKPMEEEIKPMEKEVEPMVEESKPVEKEAIPVEEPKAIEEILKPVDKEVNLVEVEKESVPEMTQEKEPEVVSQIMVEKKEVETEKEKIEIPEKEMKQDSVAAITPAGVVTAVAAATVIAGATATATTTKSKAKLAAKPTKTTTTTKTTTKPTPVSPSKAATGASRTSTSAALKKSAPSATSRAKDSDAAKKTTTTSMLSKVAASKPSATSKTTASTTATKTTTTRTSLSATKPKSTTASPKPQLTATEKKPTLNGDVKPISKPAASRTLNKASSTTTTTAAAKTSLVKTSTTTRTSAGTAAAAKPRPTSATAQAKSAVKSTTTSTTTTTTGATRPKTAPIGSTAAKSRVSSTAKSPMIDKQIKETANKQISLARTTATSTASKTTRTSTSVTSSTTTTAKRTSTTRTSTVSSPTKKATTTATKITGRVSSATKGSTVGSKTKVVQNGVSENMEITSTTIITTDNKIDDDIPKKDLSPVVIPTDNQLIMNSD